MLRVLSVPRSCTCLSRPHAFSFLVLRTFSVSSSTLPSSTSPSSLSSTEATKKHPPEPYEVVIIGGGSSGLSMSFFLSCLRRKHVVLERGSQVGNFWKDNLWDSFKTVTPGWSIQLPALDVKLEQEEDFLSQDELLAHFKQYSETMKVPLKLNQNVVNIKYESVIDDRDSSKKYLIETSSGESYLTRDVVICTGPYQSPKVPLLFKKLPSRVQSLHSSKYKNPEMVGEVVLVVGSGQSGLDIVNELVEAGKTVFFSLGRNTATFPRRYRGYDNMDWLSRMGYFDQDLKSMSKDPDRPSSAELRYQSSSSPYITNQPWFLYQLARKGVTMLGRLREDFLMTKEGEAKVLTFEALGNALEDSEIPNTDFRAAVDSFIADEKLQSIQFDPPYPPKPEYVRPPEILSLDVEHAGIQTVIFATGYGGIKFPMLTEMIKEKERKEQYLMGEKTPMWYEDGYPATANGQSIAFPGLYFLGLRWLLSAASATFFGAPFDAAVVATKIARMRGYPHQNMIAPQFLNHQRLHEEDNWNKVDEEDDDHMSESEDEGESERADQEEIRKYFPFANPEPLDQNGVVDAEILAAVLPPKPPPLDDDKLPAYIIKEKPKKPRRNLTYAELQRDQRNRQILSQSEVPKTLKELNEMVEEEENASAAGDNVFEQWQPKLSKRREKQMKKAKIDPYADFSQEEKKIMEMRNKNSFISGAHPKHKKTPGEVFSMGNFDLNKLMDEDESNDHIRMDFTKKHKKKGVRGTIERYLEGHRGLRDIQKARKPRK